MGNLRGCLGEGVTLDIYDDSSCMLPWNGERKKSHREEKPPTLPADLHTYICISSVQSMLSVCSSALTWMVLRLICLR